MRFEETDQSQVAQPELLLAILLPVTQQVIPSLTCTCITTYLSHCVFYILSSWAVLLPVTQQVIPSLTCTCITTYVSQCVLHILSSSVVLLLVALLVIASLTCSSICQVSESAHSVTQHHLIELLQCKSHRCFVSCCLLPPWVISHSDLHKYNQDWSLHVSPTACTHHEPDCDYASMLLPSVLLPVAQQVIHCMTCTSLIGS